MITLYITYAIYLPIIDSTPWIVMTYHLFINCTENIIVIFLSIISIIKTVKIRSESIEKSGTHKNSNVEKVEYPSTPQSDPKTSIDLSSISICSSSHPSSLQCSQDRYPTTPYSTTDSIRESVPDLEKHSESDSE
jgi:hypothetical protein